jgi:hypothetical protein
MRQQNSVADRPFVNAVRRWSRLSMSERQAALEAMVVVATVSALISTLPSSLTSIAIRRAIARDRHFRQPADFTTAEVVDRIRSAIARASPRIPRANCLVQALSGWWMLRRRNVDSQLRIGVEKGERGLSAHAWLCVGNTIVIGGEDAAAKFVTLKTTT